MNGSAILRVIVPTVAALVAGCAHVGTVSQPSSAQSAPAPAAAIPPAPAKKSELVPTRLISVPQANLREAGAPNAKVVRVLPKNTRLTVFGKADQWYLVQLDDGTGGWVAESVTSPAP